MPRSVTVWLREYEGSDQSTAFFWNQRVIGLDTHPRHHCGIMVRIYYASGDTNRRGMLRAVLTFAQLESVLSSEIVTYLGRKFPVSHSPSTLVEILDNEESPKWTRGFSRIQASPIEFDERLRFLPESKTENEAKPQTTSKSLGLFHRLMRRNG